MDQIYYLDIAFINIELGKNLHSPRWNKLPEQSNLYKLIYMCDKNLNNRHKDDVITLVFI